MNINLHHLELFYYVAEAGGISAAIKVMPYSIQQPAISQQMIALEESLDVKLFERRPFSLTDAGRRLLATVGPFMEDVATLEDDLKGLRRLRLKIGCPGLISENYLTQILPILMKKHPNFLPQIVELEGLEPYKSLITRDLDIVISSEKIPRSNAIKTVKILTLPFSVIISKKHPLAKNFNWDENLLRGERWISLQERTGGMRILFEEMSKIGMSPTFSAATNSISTALKYIGMNLGIGMMIQPPKFLLKANDLIAIPQKNLKHADICISYISGEDTMDMIDAFIDLSKEIAIALKKDFS